MKRGSTLMVMVAAMMLLGLGPSAFAASVTHNTTREQFSTWPASPQLDSSCPEIPSGVVITAVTNERVRQTITKTMDDGSKHIVVTDLVKGTAEDNLDGAYTFVYQNDATFDVSSDGITRVRMTDTFSLKGDNANYTAGFNWSWAFETDGFDPPNTIAFPFFSNEVFDFRELSTRGDIFHCDPI
jgi:hypothetical protein